MLGCTALICSTRVVCLTVLSVLILESMERIYVDTVCIIENRLVILHEHLMVFPLAHQVDLRG